MKNYSEVKNYFADYKISHTHTFARREWLGYGCFIAGFLLFIVGAVVAMIAEINLLGFSIAACGAGLFVFALYISNYMVRAIPAEQAVQQENVEVAMIEWLQFFPEFDIDMLTQEDLLVLINKYNKQLLATLTLKCGKP